MNKYIKYLIGFLVFLLLAYILLAVLSPKKLVLKESTKIEAPASVCFNLVNDLQKWSLWSPWQKLDTSAVHTYSDKSYGTGAQWTWKGNKNMGEGTQTIVESKANEMLKMSLEFKGYDDLAYNTWNFEQEKKNTKVSWDFEGSNTSFFMRPLNLLMKGALKKSYREGLSQLREISEKRANEKVYRGFKIEELQLDEKHYILRRKEVSFDNMQQFYSQNLGALFAKVQEASLTMNGMPSGLYFKWDELRNVADMAAAIPISEVVDLKDADTYTIPTGRAVQIDYYGDYENLAEPHTAIDEYLKDYSLHQNPPVVEEYLTDPGEESDPSKWLTRIIYYIQQ